MFVRADRVEVKWCYWINDESQLVEWLMLKAPWLEFARYGGGWIVTCYRRKSDGR